MVNLYSPQDEIELALLKSILDAEGINYFVKNDYFGSLKIGPRIAHYNAKMIEVQDDQYESAKTLLIDFIEKTVNKTAESGKYSLFDKIRMLLEVLVLGWIVPGRGKTKDRD